MLAAAFSCDLTTQLGLTNVNQTLLLRLCGDLRQQRPPVAAGGTTPDGAGSPPLKADPKLKEIKIHH